MTSYLIKQLDINKCHSNSALLGGYTFGEFLAQQGGARATLRLFNVCLCLEEIINVHLSRAVNVFPSEDSIVQGHRCVVVNKLQNFQTCHLCSL